MSVERARAELVELEGQIAALQERANKVRAAIEVMDSYGKAPNRAKKAPRTPAARSSKPVGDIAAECVKILGSADGPMSASTLVAGLARAGIKIGGSDPSQKLRSMLKGSAEITSQGKRGYVLVGNVTEKPAAAPKAAKAPKVGKRSKAPKPAQDEQAPKEAAEPSGQDATTTD